MKNALALAALVATSAAAHAEWRIGMHYIPTSITDVTYMCQRQSSMHQVAVLWRDQGPGAAIELFSKKSDCRPTGFSFDIKGVVEEVELSEGKVFRIVQVENYPNGFYYFLTDRPVLP